MKLNKSFILWIYITFSLCNHSYSQSFNTNLSTNEEEAQKLLERAIAIGEEILNNPDKQVGNFNDVDQATLPIGIVKEIGNTIYAICIDSARFTPEGASFDVFMAIDFPGSGTDNRLAFAAKNIRFNPQGVIVSNGARLQLVSEQSIRIGPKFRMKFKNDGKNFIEWDCNGYKQAGLSVDFLIDTDLLVNANNPHTPLKASMELVVEDLSNISFSIPTMDPFFVKGAEDFIFTLNNIVIDRSEHSTPAGANIPAESIALHNNDRDAWKGFYAEYASVKLPQKLSRKGAQSMEVYASNLLIDDSGLSGGFGVNNLFNDGEMNDAWSFSISNLDVQFKCNNLVSGSINGSLTVPPLDDKTFNYSASVTKNPTTQKLDYNFLLTIASGDITLNAFKSKLTLASSSQLEVASNNGKFIPTAKLTGDWTVDFTKAKISGVRFQNLVITTQAPYITSGVFSLVSNQNESNCTQFPISISNIGMALTPQQQLSIFADIGLSLGGSSFEFGVNTSIRVITKLENDQGKLRLKYDRFAINDIALACSTSVFHLQGLISIRNDDPIFGDLFFGSISLKISGVLENPLMVSAGFGKFPEYKYWFTDVSLPITIPIFAGVYIKSIYGGVQNKVASTLTTSQLLDRVAGQITTTPESSGSALPFVPDPNKGLTFRAGVGLMAQSEKVFNGDVLLSISFNPSGGFQSIDFAGRAFMMVKRTERQKTNATKVQGEVYVSYDNSAKIFDAQLAAQIIVPSILSGGLNIKLHISEQDWYFWLNRPTQRAHVNLVDLATVQTYFMIGTQIEAIPPPPSYVSNIVGYSGNSIDINALGNGSGFCTGLDIGVNFGGEFPKNTNWRGFIEVNVGGGFDVMIFNSENTRCVGRSEPIGVNGYYAVGQVYVYVGGALGAKRYKNGELKNQYNVGSLSVAALLQGKLPKPTFVYGAIGVECEVLGIIKFNFSADVEFGNDCNFTSI